MKRSASGMEKDTRDFSGHLRFRPLGVLGSKPGRFQFARRPVELRSQRKTPFGRHSSEGLNLLGAGLLIRQHQNSVRLSAHPSKLFAFANASSSLPTSLPPPRALSGRPPPFPDR